MFARLFPAAAAAAAALSSVCGTSLAQTTATPQAPPAAVQVESLQTLDLFTTGAGDTGLKPDLWRGSSAALARQVLSRIAGGEPMSPAAAMLARRVLATAANAPDGAGTDADLAGTRALALIAVGDAPGADAILKAATNLPDSPLGSRAAAEAALIGGDDARACAVAKALKLGRDGPYWLKLRTYCQAMAGETDAAQLTFSLANGAANDPLFRRLMGAKLAGAGPPGAASLRDGLDLALTRSLALDPAPALDGASLSVAATVARSLSYAPDTRVAAAARALRGAPALQDLFDHGLAPISVPVTPPPGSPDLAAVATSVPAETVIRALAAKPGVQAEAGLVVVATQQSDPAVKLRALGVLFDRARTGPDVVALARLARPALTSLAQTEAPVPLSVARAAAAAGDIASAHAFRARIAPAASASDLAVLDVMIAVAGGDRDDDAFARLIAAGAEAGPKSPAQPAALLMLALEAAATSDDQARLAAFDVGRGTASPAKLAMLEDAASTGRRKGQVALLALSLALDAGPAGPPPADRARIVSALNRAGLGIDARDFALEGLAGLK